MANIVKRIKKLSLTVLGCEAEPWDNVWERIKDLADAFGPEPVAEVFEEWAKTRRGEIVRKPVEEFLKIAPGLLQGITSLKPDQELVNLLNELAYITQGTVVFDAEQQIAIGRLVIKYSTKQVKDSFREFYNQISGDDFLIKHAARKFVETAEQLIYVQQRLAKDAEDLKKLQTRLGNEAAREVQEELNNLPPEEEEIVDFPI